MVVRVWAGDVDRSADDFARVEERVDRDSGGEAVEEVPSAEIFNCQRRFAFRQNRVSHMVMLSSVVVASLDPTRSFRRGVGRVSPSGVSRVPRRGDRVSVPDGGGHRVRLCEKRPSDS
jgi:hypothetical protein